MIQGERRGKNAEGHVVGAKRDTGISLQQDKKSVNEKLMQMK